MRRRMANNYVVAGMPEEARRLRSEIDRVGPGDASASQSNEEEESDESSSSSSEAPQMGRNWMRLNALARARAEEE